MISAAVAHFPNEEDSIAVTIYGSIDSYDLIILEERLENFLTDSMKFYDLDALLRAAFS